MVHTSTETFFCGSTSSLLGFPSFKLKVGIGLNVEGGDKVLVGGQTRVMVVTRGKGQSYRQCVVDL